MDDNGISRWNMLLEVITEQVAKRLEARWKLERVKMESRADASPAAPASSAPKQPLASIAQPEPEPEPPQPAEAVPDTTLIHTFHAAPLMARLALAVLIIVVLINVPLNAQGTALARSIPNTASLVIRNGLVVKEETSPDIYVYGDGSFHWITSLDAFEHLGFRWQDVHVVERGFLDQFEKGKPIYVLLKCDSSPHIYRLEGGTKRWIVDISTFVSEGHVWKEVKSVSCNYLRNLPDGESIPPGRGLPPPPLP